MPDVHFCIELHSLLIWVSFLTVCVTRSGQERLIFFYSKIWLSWSLILNYGSFRESDDIIGLTWKMNIHGISAWISFDGHWPALIVALIRIPWSLLSPPPYSYLSIFSLPLRCHSSTPGLRDPKLILFSFWEKRAFEKWNFLPQLALSVMCIHSL